MRSSYSPFFKLLAILVSCLPISCMAQRQGASIPFSFNLNKAASTSAGVYAGNGRLVKTLWSGVQYTAGNHRESWDGTNDAGQTAPKGQYTVKVLSNNVKYAWEGVIGNTSDSLTGETVYRSLEHIWGIAITGDTAYLASGYAEQSASTYKFRTGDPQKRYAILGKGVATRFVATDGINVYWAGRDIKKFTPWFVYATKTSDDSETSFREGKQLKTMFSRTFASALDVRENSDNEINGLAVQKKGNWLFVSHKDMGVVDVVDKRTGALKQAFHVDSPSVITVDRKDNLWVGIEVNNKPLVRKYTVKADGNLSAVADVTGLEAPLALAVSPDNTTLLIADGGNSQQVKAYNNASGIFKWALGKAQGYYADPDVSNDKFYFSDKRGVLGSTIAFQPNGSFWIEDAGNDRLQHYSAAHTYLDRIMFLRMSYSTSVDLNNIQRLFSDYLEFKVDYTKPLSPNNGSWTLVKNWGSNITTDMDNKYMRFHTVATLSNGRTYTTIYNRVKHKWLIAELPAHGLLRVTNTEFDNLERLYADGSVRSMTIPKPGQPVKWSLRPLIKFDANYAPVWGLQQTLASVSSFSASDPVPSRDALTMRPAEMTSSDLIIVYGNTKVANGDDNWHLAAIHKGDSQWMWRTAKGTERSYRGPFPADGGFDNGNGVRNAGSVALVKDKNIIWGYYGEFWKNSEVNKWNHVYDDGLFVGQFGITGPEGRGMKAAPMMAGNAFSAVLVKDSAGDMYLYHNDENQHSGVHRWKISNLNSIQEQSIQIKL